MLVDVDKLDMDTIKVHLNVKMILVGSLTVEVAPHLNIQMRDNFDTKDSFEYSI